MNYLGVLYNILPKRIRYKKYYSGIKEMPASKWLMMYEENDLKYLSKNGKICNLAAEVYQKMKDEIIDNFGANEDYLRMIRNNIQIQLMYCEQNKTGDKSTQAFIEILELENEKLKGEKATVDNYEIIIGIEKSVPFDINTKSVYAFYKYANIISKQNGWKGN